MKHLLISLLAALSLVAVPAIQAEQVADLSYKPPIPRPTYAFGTGPKVLIDEGHNNFHTVTGRFLPFANLLRRDGYRVEGFTGDITREKLAGIRVLVIANPVNDVNVNNWTLPTPSAYTTDEIAALHDWVQDGGSLLLIADHMPFPGGAGELAQAFGATYSNGYAVSGNSNGWVDVYSSTTGLQTSFITEGRPGDEPVTSVGTFGGSAFTLPPGATPILLFGAGALSHETTTAPGITPGAPTVDINGWSQGAYLQYGQGRLALFGEAAMFSAQLSGTEKRTMGMNDAGAAQNYRLVLNLFRWLGRADVLVDLDPNDALYDSDVSGFVTDNGNGPGSASHFSGVPEIADSGDHRHDSGFTFNVSFTPAEADLQGTRLLIELGGALDGTGLYLIDGVPTLITAQNGAAAGSQEPNGNATPLPHVVVHSSIGTLKAGTFYAFSASWNHQGNLELKVAENQGVPVIDQFAITGTFGDWSGNDTLNVRTPDLENLGGLSGNGGNIAAFEGEIGRALFWNASSFTPWLTRSDIGINLDPSSALYDSDVRGFVTDNGYGPANTNNQSGVPAIDDNGTRRHAYGFTFYVTFKPTEADLQGTRLLIELGAYINGGGLYLVNGVPTLIDKQSSADNQVPASLNDTTLPAIAVQSSMGVLKAGTPYAFSASWDHKGHLELKVSENQGTPVTNLFTITGTYGNWSGNDTLNIRTPDRANLGGLSGYSSSYDYGLPFDVDYTAAFEGEINRALFWNSYAFSSTIPTVYGFGVTALPSQGKVRLHWNISTGALAELVPTVTIRDASDTVIYRATVAEGTGFYDVQSDQIEFTLEVSNSSGTSKRAAATLESQTSFAQAVRGDNPVLWYRFNEAGDAAWAVDSADNAVPFDGLSNGSAVSGGKGLIDGAAAFGTTAIETGFVFNPADFSAQKPHGGFSIETIVRLSSEHNALTALVSQKDVNGTGRNIVGVLEDGTLFTFIGGVSQRTSTTTLEKGRWTHVVLVVDAGGDEVRWYIDGILAGRSTGTALGIESTQGGWVIGANKYLATPFKGQVDEVAVYNTLLDDPNGDGDLSDSHIPFHRNAWWNEFAQATLSSDRIAAGNSVTLTLDLRDFITSVQIDGVSTPITIANGKAVLELTPAETTTYRILLGGDLGTAVREVTVTVDGSLASDEPPRIHESYIDGQNFVLIFSGHADTEYRVTGSYDLNAFDQEIETIRTDAQGNATVNIPIEPDQPKRFFRIETVD